MGPTEKVRDYVRTEYVDAARRARKSEFQVIAGDVHRALQFRNRVPLVCQALTGQKFLTENGLTLDRTEGPPSGLGATATFFYRLTAKSDLRAESSFLRLRGAGKQVFQSLGGGEKFLRAERTAFDRK